MPINGELALKWRLPSIVLGTQAFDFCGTMRVTSVFQFKTSTGIRLIILLIS